jgi:hypothetical protein
MMRRLYIYIVKSRLKGLNRMYRRYWAGFGPEHKHTLFIKARWYNTCIDAIETLEKWDA